VKIGLCRPPAAALVAALAIAPSAPRARAEVPTTHADRGEPSAPVRILTGLDDARACTPLAAGGFAVATAGGLAIVARDGTVRVLTSVDGLPETRVHAVAEQSGGVWIGTEAGAAFVSLSGDRPAVTRVVGSDPVQAVFASASGSTFFGTREAGVVVIDAPDAPPRVVPSAAPGVRVAGITESAGVLYVAYADGPLARRDGDTLRALPGSPTRGHALAASDGDVWLGDLEGLFRVGRDGSIAPVASVDARGIAVHDHGLLVATMGAGLQEGSSRGALHTVPGVPALARGVGVAGAVQCVATDEGVFVGEGSDLRRLPLGGLPSNDVTAFAASQDGRVAIGTFDRGAYVGAAGSWQAVPGVGPHETVNAVAWQGDRLWIATARGLVGLDASGRSRRTTSADGLPSSVVRAIHVLSREKILVGTDGGPAYAQSGTDGDQVEPLGGLPPHGKGTRADLASPMHATWAVASGADGTLFLGTTAGLYYGKDGQFRRASVASGTLEDDWVTALAVDGEDVFVGTYSKGVTHLRFGAPELQAVHLGGGYVNAAGLVEHDGRLYAATMEGARVRAEHDDAAPWRVVAAPAPGRDVTAVGFLSSEVWLTSRRGIAVIDGRPTE
jgi:hypothetical protein